MNNEQLIPSLRQILNNEQSAKEFLEDFKKEFQKNIDTYKKVEDAIQNLPDIQRQLRAVRDSKEWTLIVVSIMEAFILNQLSLNRLFHLDRDVAKMNLDMKIREVSENQTVSKEDKEVLEWIRNYMKRAKSDPDL